MSVEYGVEWAEKKVILAKATKVDLTYSVTVNGAAFDLTGKQLDAVVKDIEGVTVDSWSSTGSSPAITISTSTFNILDNSGFNSVGIYFCYLMNTTDNEPIAKIVFTVEEFIKVTAP